MAMYAAIPGVDPGLDQPWYGIGFGKAIVRFFKKYKVFTGRASRGEFWWVFLFNGLIGLAVAILLLSAGINWDMLFALGMQTTYAGPHVQMNVFQMLNGFGITMMIISWAYTLATLVPTIAVGIRRLHDTGRSGWWWLVYLIPTLSPLLSLISNYAVDQLIGLVQAGCLVWYIVLMATKTNPRHNRWDPDDWNGPWPYPAGTVQPTFATGPMAPGVPTSYQSTSSWYPPAAPSYPPGAPSYPPVAPTYPPVAPTYPPAGPAPQPPASYPPPQGSGWPQPPNA